MATITSWPEVFQCDSASRACDSQQPTWPHVAHMRRLKVLPHSWQLSALGAANSAGLCVHAGLFAPNADLIRSIGAMVAEIDPLACEPAHATSRSLQHEPIHQRITLIEDVTVAPGHEGFAFYAGDDAVAVAHHGGGLDPASEDLAGDAGVDDLVA
jgi:hypothetical protein